MQFLVSVIGALAAGALTKAGDIGSRVVADLSGFGWQLLPCLRRK
jgi:hypothetical protein